MKARSVLRWLRTPKASLVAALLVLVAAAAPGEGPGRITPQLVVAMGAAAMVDLLLNRVRYGTVGFPDGALISGLLVAIVLIPGAPLAVAALAAALAVASKFFLRTKQVHLFNPAALGLLLCLVLVPTGQSWWGSLTDLPWPAIVILLGCAGLTAYRVHRLPMMLAFLGIYFTIFALAALPLMGIIPRIAEIFRVPFLNAAIFLGGFMLTDPVTSPARPQEQVWFGAVAAVFSAVCFMTQTGMWFLLAGLLAANGWWAWRRTVAASLEAGDRSGWAGAVRGN
ncbi:MAG TPA: RnfABCDGE type electron transport complex subunit D [Candidatus Dormibacteraeota bacterium]|nr:RnfABCDGE type electron transport complex subunit D [Candidatus Dormibacteraeota bacterium]